MNASPVVIVILAPKQGLSASVVSEMRRELDEIRSSAGCLAYDVFQRVDDEVVLVERWESREAWQAHFDTPAIRRLKHALTPLLRQPAERWELYSADRSP